MQPMANIKPRAEFAQSAPMASTLAMSKALTILPLASFYGYRCYKGLQDAA